MEIKIKRSGIFILLSVLSGTLILWIGSVTAEPDISFTFMDGANDPKGGDHNASFVDIDNDDIDELYTNYWPKRCYTYSNGSWSDVSDATGGLCSEDRTGDHGIVFFDADNDGDFDFMDDDNYLFTNNGGGYFTDRSNTAGLSNYLLKGSYQEDIYPHYVIWETRGVSAGDIDGDGDNDLWVTGDGYHLGSYTPPRNFFFINQLKETGTLSFIEDAANRGSDSLGDMSDNRYREQYVRQGSLFFDYDDDGDLDLYITVNGSEGWHDGPYCCEAKNELWENDGTGHFTEVAVQRGIEARNSRGGTNVGDLDNDGDLDVVVDAARIYLYNNATNSYTLSQTFDFPGFASSLADFDHDGDTDIYPAGANRILENDGSGTFVARNVISGGSDSWSNLDARGTAMADYDNDGDMDVYWTHMADKPWYGNTRGFLLRNDLSANNNWLKVKLIGPHGDAAAIGAKVRIYENGHVGDMNYFVSRRDAISVQGYMDNHSQILHFGLDGSRTYDVLVTFLTGESQTLRNVSTGQLLTVNGSSNELPIAVISVDGTSIVDGKITVEPGELLQFRGSGSSDPDGTIQSYQWNFGDGSTADVPDPTHAFQNAGTYTVSLTVTDNDGGRDTETLTVQMVPECQSAVWDFRGLPVGSTLSCTLALDLTDASSATLSYTAEDVDDPTEATWHINQGSPQNASATGDGLTKDFTVPLPLTDLTQGQNTVFFTFESDLNGSTSGFSVWNIDIVLEGGNALDRSGKLWEPVEWTLENLTYSGNPFDLDATVTFIHGTSGETRTTGMFYDGDNAWKYRFTGTQIGTWTFTSSSDDPDLNGKSGTVTVESNSGVAGFMTNYGDKWGRLGLDEAFVPQYVMYGDPGYFYNNPGRVDTDLQTFMVEHGFSGFHVPIFCRWFDINQPTNVNLPSDPNPDLRTFEALEMLITKVHEAGGVVHFWMWGDDERDQTPVRWGKNGTVDKRLQRYIAARLGPLPGWSMSYGFDLDEWVVEDDLREWHSYMQQHFGWSHFLGARDPGPNSPSEPFNQIYEGLDYSSYEHHKPDYNRYVETLEARPTKPSFSEDRFRMRDEGREKDYNMEETRRGMWHSTMAGGVANIWGNLLNGGDISAPYPNPEQIRTYASFFEDRFKKDMFRCNNLTDGVCLQQPDNAHFIFYKEDTNSIQLNLSGMAGAQMAVAVDTKNDYVEIDLGTITTSDQTWNAPYTSDWAIAVGNFDDSIVTCDGDLNEDGQVNNQDVQLMVDAILEGNPNGLCADLNDDHIVNTIDLQYLVNQILDR